MGDKTFTFNITEELYKDIAIEAIKHERSTEEEIWCAIAFYLNDVLKREYLKSFDVEKADERDSVRHLNYLHDLNEKYDKYFKKRD